MRRNYILFIFLFVFSTGMVAQSLEQAKVFFQKKQYEKAKPIFKRYVKNNPGNANYNQWYGISCYETGDKAEAEPYLLKAAAKKIQEAYRYLGAYYFETYRFGESEEYYEKYIDMLKKKKKPVEEYEKLLAAAKLGARMLKGVEEVTFIDSFVVDKNDFLQTYKISEESGRLFTYDEYFGTKGKNPGTVYQNQLDTKVYYGDRKDKHLTIYSKTKLLNEWGKPHLLPGIDGSADQNYPYMLSDGVTLYYASDNEGSLGGYDIFVTRYNSESDNYLAPENVGMPFNSPFNDYMYVVDEYNNLGWFASDRYQPEDKVCVYVFIPNSSKQVYNYEGTDVDIIRRAAIIQSIKDSWKNMEEVKAAKQRLAMVIYHRPQEKPQYDFEFVIDDNTVYHVFDDFTSSKAKTLFKQWRQKEADYEKLEKSLENKRLTYAQSKAEKKKSMAREILDLEKRTEQMQQELGEMATSIRNEEIRQLTQ